MGQRAWPRVLRGQSFQPTTRVAQRDAPQIARGASCLRVAMQSRAPRIFLPRVGCRLYAPASFREATAGARAACVVVLTKTSHAVVRTLHYFITADYVPSYGSLVVSTQPVQPPNNINMGPQLSIQPESKESE